MFNLKLIGMILDSRATQSFNQLIYFLQKVPVLKLLISDKWYRRLEFKGVLFGLQLLLVGAKYVITGFTYFMLIIGSIGLMLDNASEIPVFLRQILKGDELLIFKNLLVITSLFSFSLFQMQLISSADRDLYVGTRLFQIPPRTYLFVTEMLEALRKLTFMSLPLMVIFGRNGQWWQGPCFVVFVVGLRLFLRTVTLPLYNNDREDKTQLVTNLSLSSFGLLTVLGLLWTIFGSVNVSIFYSPVALIIGLGLWLFSAYRLIAYQKLDLLVRQIVTVKSIASFSQIVESVEVQALEVKDDEIAFSESQIESKTTGIAYLNQLFSQRYGKLIRKKIFNRVKIILGVTVLLNALFYLTTWVDRENLQAFWTVLAISLYIGFLIYPGEFLMKMSFYQMDRPLLRFSFYRDKTRVIEILKARFIMVLKFNFPIFLALVISFLSVYLYAFDWVWKDVLLLLGTLLIGLVFFSLYHLYLYFLFQPFTKGMATKSPAYSIINLIIMGTSYQIFKLDSANALLVVLTTMTLFLVIGYFAVLHFAPKTFILK